MGIEMIKIPVRILCKKDHALMRIWCYECTLNKGYINYFFLLKENKQQDLWYTVVTESIYNDIEHLFEV